MDKVPGLSSSSEEDEDDDDISSSSYHLIPPMEKGYLMDWSGWLIECPNCPGRKFPISLLDAHRGWHARVNLLIHLTTMINKDSGSATFGPGVPGSFLKVVHDEDPNYDEDHDDDEVLDHDDMKTSCPPFVHFKYLDGLKYTFGNVFMSREVQGEFVYLSLQKDEDRRPERFLGNYFSLECRDQGLWISMDQVKELCPSILLSVNGIPLLLHDGRSDQDRHCSSSTMKKQVKLAFGDVVTVAHKSKTRFVDFIFKASVNQPPPPPSPVNFLDDVVVGNAKENMFGGGGPLVNPLILQNVMSFLPTSVAKEARFVSSLWNSEALKDLRRRVVVVVKIYVYIPNGTDDSNLMPVLLNFTTSSLNELKFPHWEVRLPFNLVDTSTVDVYGGFSISQVGYGPKETRRRTMAMQKVLDDLTWLMDPQVHTNKLESLTLTVMVDSAHGLKWIRKVLVGLGKMLKTLNLELHSYCYFYHQHRCSLTPLYPSSSEFLPGLKSLSMTLANNVVVDPVNLIPSFLNGFLRRVTNIEELTLNNHRPSSENVVPSVSFSAVVLVGMASLQAEEEGRDKFKFLNLNKVTLGGEGRHSFLHLVNSLHGVNLRKLDLQLTEDSDEEETLMGELFSVLSKYEGSLEDLTLRVQPSMTLFLQFPVEMPKLQSLSVLLASPLSGYPAWFEFGSREEEEEDPEDDDDDGMNRIDYNLHFPSLSKLTIWPVNSDYKRSTLYTDESWDQFEPVLSSFITPWNEGEEVEAIVSVPAIKLLDIPFLLRGKYHEVLNDLELVFPNAVFPKKLEDARQHPVWTPEEEDEEDEENETSSSDEDEEENEASSSDEDEEEENEASSADEDEQ